MKWCLLLSILVMSQAGFGQTIRDQKIKQEMLERVEKISKKVEETREELKAERVEVACANIKELFDIYPDHVLAIGMRMDLLSRPIDKIKHESLNQLIFFDRQHQICKKGTGCEWVDIKVLDKELKRIQKSLKKQTKLIKKKDTTRENHYRYEYNYQY